jgi:cytochrome c oxidase cbb3-type subunit 1
VNADGTLTYSFVESVQAMYPYYIVRTMGGACFLIGTLIMACNLWKTIANAKPIEVAVPIPIDATPLAEPSVTGTPNPGMPAAAQ